MGVEINLLGRFSVWRDGTEVPSTAFRGRMVRTLVRVLVARRGSFVSRDALVDALWHADPPADPDLNLNVLVTRARRALGDPALILTGPGGYSFASTPGCTVDAEQFLQLVGARQMSRALELWAGEPLAEDAYEEWAQGYRHRLAQAHLEALEGAAAEALAAGDPARAVAWARMAVALEPLREAAHLLAARGLAASNDAAGALETLAELRRRLADELGLDPSAEAQDLEARILRGEAEPRPPRGRRTEAGQFPGLAFIGRDVELAQVMAATGGVALVAGPSGSGKSRLLAEVAEVAARTPAPVLSVRAAPSERDEPWHLARALIRAAVAAAPEALATLGWRSAAALADIVPELPGPAHDPSDPGPAFDVETRRALALEGAVALVDAAAGSGLVAVDDLQWADASSLAVLDRVAGRLAGVSLVLAYRPEEVTPGGPAALFLEGLPGSARLVARVTLGPLTAASLAAAVAGGGLVAAIVEETDASPMAAAELIRELAGRGAVRLGSDGRWVASSTGVEPLAREAGRRGHRRMIEARIDRHPPSNGELVSLLALLGRPVPARLLAAATGDGAVLERLEALGRSGLVQVGGEGWSAAHDLIAEVAAQRLAPTTRARLHEVLAGALAGEGADPAEVARHLAGAGDRAAAGAAYARAAGQRLASFAHREAEQVAEAGLALHPMPEARSALLEVRAEVRATTGDLPGARDDLRGALAGAASGLRRSHLLARMALLASGAEDLARAEEVAELALAEAGSDPAARAQALSVAAIIDMNADRQDQARKRSDEALELFRATGNARGIADVLDGRAMATFMSGDVRGAVPAFDRVARLFEDSGDLLRVGTPRSTRGHALTFMAKPAEGLVDATAALELARALGHAEGEAYAGWHRAEALAALGRAGEATESATAALAIAERVGHREWTAACLRGLGTARQAAGDLDGAEAAFRRSLATSEHLSLFAAWAAARTALVLIARGDLAAAAPLVARSLAEGPALSRYEARLARAELAVASGDPAAGEAVGTALELAEAGGHLASAERLMELRELGGWSEF